MTDELKVMKRVHDLLMELDDASRQRALRWVNDVISVDPSREKTYAILDPLREGAYTIYQAQPVLKPPLEVSCTAGLGAEERAT